MQIEGAPVSHFYRAHSVLNPLSMSTSGLEATSRQRLLEKPRATTKSQTLRFNMQGVLGRRTTLFQKCACFTVKNDTLSVAAASHQL